MNISRHSNLEATYFFVAVLTCAFLGSGIGAPLTHETAPSSQKPATRNVTLNGIAFSIPKAYAQIPQTEIPNSAFLFYRKYGEGLIVAVPTAPFDQNDLLNTLTEAGVRRFFPRATQPFEWKRLDRPRKLSKFEIGGDQSMGFNKKSLIIVHAHHFRVADNDIFVTDLFKWDHGDVKEKFAGGLGGESMQGCNDMVTIVYSITGEKIDETNSPCELIALSPGR